MPASPSDPNGGWFCLHRKIFESPDIAQLTDAERWVAIYLMSLARIRPTKTTCSIAGKLDVPRGALVCSYGKIARTLGRSHRTVRETVRKLLATGTLIQLGGTHAYVGGGSSPIVRFAKFEDYQNGATEAWTSESEGPDRADQGAYPVEQGGLIARAGGPDRADQVKRNNNDLNNDLNNVLITTEIAERGSAPRSKGTRQATPASPSPRKPRATTRSSPRQLTAEHWTLLGDLRKAITSVDAAHTLSGGRAWERAKYAWSATLIKALESGADLGRLRHAASVLGESPAFAFKVHAMADLVSLCDRIIADVARAKAASERREAYARDRGREPDRKPERPEKPIPVGPALLLDDGVYHEWTDGSIRCTEHQPLPESPDAPPMFARPGSVRLNEVARV